MQTAPDRARHDERARLLASALRDSAESLALAKDTSNLFRDRASTAARRLDVRAFCDILSVDSAAGTVDAEGMATYASVVEATLARGVMPAVVPQLKSITIGGAVAGVGIEASSFRYGLVHETLLEIEVLTGRGDVVRCTPENDHRDLFFGFPNSYGTLGYALSVRAATVPVRPFVRISHRRFSDAERFFSALADECARKEANFVDGVVFGPDEFRLTTGTFVDEAPYTSDYTFENMYYQSLRQRTEDYLTTRDFIWRWDTDWFWCSKNLGAQNPLLRRLLGRARLNSETYTKVMRWNSRLGLTRRLDRALGWHTESVIQDVDIPVARAPDFLESFVRGVGIFPIWICPIHAHDPRRSYPLYPVRHDTLYVNFGFWDVVKRRKAFEYGHHNRLIEGKVEELGGIKSLYSESYFDRDTFRRAYGGADYDALKRKYDPKGRFPDLYEKVVMRR